MKIKRKRMTDQSVANVKSAKNAFIINESNGYKIELIGASNKSCNIENANGPIIYSSKTKAAKAVIKHNSQLQPRLKPTI